MARWKRALRTVGVLRQGQNWVNLLTMDDAERIAEETAYRAEVEKHFRWNFAVNVLDGAFFWLGINFAAPSTIMPLYVSHLTDNRVLIGLISAITGAGWYLPQLLTANYVEQMPVKKRLVVNVGLFSERLPFLVMALSVFLFARRSANWALLFFFLTLVWHTVGAGVVAISWQDMVAKVIPVNYRGRLLGLANFIGSATGLLGAALAAAVLARFPFPINFGICVSLTFAFLMASWFALALTREPPLHSRKPAVSLREYGRRLPAVLRNDRNFLMYLLSRVMAVFGKAGVGFVTVYAVQRWHLTDSQAGLYTTVLLAGQTAANLISGVVADRRGHKLVLESGLALLVLAMLVAVLAPAPVWMCAVFAALGALNATDLMSAIVLPMEFSSPDERPTYIGLANTIPGLFAAIAPLLGGWFAARTSYSALFLVAGMLSLLAWAILHWMVKEPRNYAT